MLLSLFAIFRLACFFFSLSLSIVIYFPSLVLAYFIYHGCLVLSSSTLLLFFILHSAFMLFPVPYYVSFHYKPTLINFRDLKNVKSIIIRSLYKAVWMRRDQLDIRTPYKDCLILSRILKASMFLKRLKCRKMKMRESSIFFHLFPHKFRTENEVDMSVLVFQKVLDLLCMFLYFSFSVIE